MPSTRYRALLVALLVVLAGCSALPGGGTETTDPGPAVQRVAFLSSSVHGYNATITISRNGSQVLERNLTFADEERRYVDLTTLDTPGTYTVRIDTDIPGVGGGVMTERDTIEVDPGPEQTVIHTTYNDIEFVTGPAADADADVSVPVKYYWQLPIDGNLTYTIYRGNTTVVSNDVAGTAMGVDGVEEAGELNTPGVYWVVATTSTSDETTVRAGVVNESTGMVYISTARQGETEVEFPMVDDE